MREGKWKLVWDVELQHWELYDVEADRTETKDLVAKHPSKVRELASAYDRWAEATGHTGKPPPKKAGPSRAESGPMILKPGQQFSLTLESNPTTGYQWRLAKPIAGSCVALVTNQFVRPSSKLTGAPGRETWKFKALQPGETVIALEYVRPWEKGGEPAQKTKVVVRVTGPTTQ